MRACVCVCISDATGYEVLMSGPALFLPPSGLRVIPEKSTLGASESIQTISIPIIRTLAYTPDQLYTLGICPQTLPQEDVSTEIEI